MIDKDLIMDRLNEIRNGVNRLRKFSEIDVNDFINNPDNYAIAEHYLRRVLEALLDIGRHIIAREGLGKPGTYREILTILADNDILDRDYVQKIVGMAGYRNRLVHMYAEVTCEEIYALLRERLDDFDEFLNEIINYTDKIS